MNDGQNPVSTEGLELTLQEFERGQVDRPGATDDPTRLLYGELARAFDYLNEALFELRLPRPLVTLRAEGRSLSYFAPHRFTNELGLRIHEIALNAASFSRRAPEEILAQMLREMVVMDLFERKLIARPSYQNAAFAEVMETLGLVTSDTWKPGGKRTGQGVGHYLVPDGKFLKIVTPFLETGFRAQWADRFSNGIEIVWEPEPLTEMTLAEVEANAPTTAIVDTPTEKPWAPDTAPEFESAGLPSHLSAPAPPETEPPSQTSSPEEEASQDAPAKPKRPQPLPQGPVYTPAAPAAVRHPQAYVEETATSRRTRSKYACAACKLAAWARPNVHLLCGECHRRLDEVEPADPPKAKKEPAPASTENSEKPESPPQTDTCLDGTTTQDEAN